MAQAYRNLYDTILLGMVDTLSKRPGVVDVKVKEQPGADQVDRQSSVVPPSPSVPSCLVPALAYADRTFQLQAGITHLRAAVLYGFLQLQIREWQRKYGVTLPADLARFLATNDGLTMVWSIQHHGKVGLSPSANIANCAPVPSASQTPCPPKLVFMMCGETQLALRPTHHRHCRPA